MNKVFCHYYDGPSLQAYILQLTVDLHLSFVMEL